MTTDSDIARFMTKIEQRGDCMIWTGALDGEGYPSFRVDGRAVRGHRWWYSLSEVIPPGFDLDHTCHNVDLKCPGGHRCHHRACVNPLHLEPVTRAENLARSPHVMTLGERHQAKDRCPADHPYSGDNLAIRKSGARSCRACARDRAQRRYWADPEAHRKASRERQRQMRKAG